MVHRQARAVAMLHCPCHGFSRQSKFHSCTQCCLQFLCAVASSSLSKPLRTAVGHIKVTSALQGGEATKRHKAERPKSKLEQLMQQDQARKAAVSANGHRSDCQNGAKAGNGQPNERSEAAWLHRGIVVKVCIAGPARPSGIWSTAIIRDSISLSVLCWSPPCWQSIAAPSCCFCL